MSQIEHLKIEIKNNLVSNFDKYFSDYLGEKREVLLESKLGQADTFLKRLKTCAQSHLEPFGRPIGLSKEDIEKKKELLKDTIFYAESGTPSQLIWHGKKHEDYYSIHITDLQGLTDKYLDQDHEYLRCHTLDKLILKMYLYYHVVATGETMSEGTSFMNMAVSDYFKGRSFVTAFFQWMREVLYVFILFGVPLILTFNSYFNASDKFPMFLTITSIWYLIFFPRYILNKYFDRKQDSLKHQKYVAYNNLWLGCFYGKTHIASMQKTIQDLISHKNMIFESGLKVFLDYLVEKYGKSF